LLVAVTPHSDVFTIAMGYTIIRVEITGAAKFRGK
jgi:hypothetical protein